MRTDVPTYRRLIELQIATAIIDTALAEGYHVEIWNGGDEAWVEHTRDRAEILDGLLEADDDTIHFCDERGTSAGYVHLVSGNGYHVICQTSGDVLAERLTAPAVDLAETIEDWVIANASSDQEFRKLMVSRHPYGTRFDDHWVLKAA